jgi:hypothetical protein
MIIKHAVMIRHAEVSLAAPRLLSVAKNPPLADQGVADGSAEAGRMPGDLKTAAAHVTASVLARIFAGRLTPSASRSHSAAISR